MPHELPKSYAMAVVPVDAADERKVTRTYRLLFKVLNFVVLPLVLGIVAFLAAFEGTDGREAVVMSLLVGAALNGGHAVAYVMARRQFRGASKLIVTGVVARIVKVHGRVPRTVFYLGEEGFDPLRAHESTYDAARREPAVGDRVSVHFVLKPNGRRGSLLLVRQEGS